MNRFFPEKNTIHLLLLLFILLVSVAYRFYGLDRLSLWADELWVVMASTKGSLMDMFLYVYYNDNHPPGHYLFMRYWQQLFGDSDYAIRFPFAVSGVFLVYSTYKIAREHYSIEAGLIAAALVSGISPMIYYSQEARANIMIAVTALWSLHYFCRLVIQPESRDSKNLVGFWITSVIGCYLHYSGLVYFFCLGGIYCGLLLMRRQVSDFLFGLKLFIPVVVLYIPWIPGMIHHMTHPPAGAWWSAPEWSDLYTSFRDLFRFGSVIFILYKIVFVALWVILCISFINRKKINLTLASIFRTSEEALLHSMHVSSMILGGVVMPVMVFFIKSRISQPTYDTRHFIYAIPLLSMSAGFLISLCFLRLTERDKNITFILVVVFILFTQNHFNMTSKLYTGQHSKQEYRESARVLVSDTTVFTSNIFIVANSDFFNHYLQRSLNGRTMDYFFSNPQQMPALDDIIKSRKPVAVYFLETPETGGYKMISSLDKTLAEFYRPVCRTGFHYAQAIKFSLESPVAIDWDKLPVCP